MAFSRIIFSRGGTLSTHWQLGRFLPMATGEALGGSSPPSSLHAQHSPRQLLLHLLHLQFLSGIAWDAQVQKDRRQRVRGK